MKLYNFPSYKIVQIVQIRAIKLYKVIYYFDSDRKKNLISIRKLLKR